MKKTTLVLFLFAATLANAQTMRYFEVGMRLDPQTPGLDWRDTSFIVAADDSALLALADMELAKAPAERTQHLTGALSGGNGGFNHNAGHWFNWHMLPNSWSFADFSVEVCDGRPFTDVQTDTAYWIGNIGYFCPWSSYLKREVSIPLDTKMPWDSAKTAFRIVPNPSDSETMFSWNMTQHAPAALSIIDTRGSLSLKMFLGELGPGAYTKPVSTSALDSGLYIAVLEVEGRTVSDQFVVRH